MNINSLNIKYTFENFIVNNCNKHAYDIAIEIADNPLRKFNPLVISGENGLGKTHLMKAIGNRIKKNNPQFNVCYMRIDELLDEITKSINEKNTEIIVDKFSNIDVLLIDDIVFITGKERYQEILLKIFTIMINNNKQIVITSDRCLEQIEMIRGLENKIKNGLELNISIPYKRT